MASVDEQQQPRDVEPVVAGDESTTTAAPAPAAVATRDDTAIIEQTESTLTPSAWANKVPRPKQPAAETLAAVRDEQRAVMTAQASQAQAQLESAKQEFTGAQDVKGKALGGWSVVRSAFMTTATAAAAALNRGVDAASERLALLRFRHYFPTPFGKDESLVCAFTAKALHNGGIPITGTVFVTTTRLCYHNQGSIALSLPLADVVSVAECVWLPTYDTRPYLIVKPDENVISTSLQVFATERRLFEFIDVSPFATDQVVELGNHRFKAFKAAAMLYAGVFDAWGAHVPGREVAGVDYSDL